MRKNDFIEVIIRTSDGGFESSLKVPVDSTPEQRSAFTKLWVEAMANVMAHHHVGQETKDEEESVCRPGSSGVPEAVR